MFCSNSVTGKLRDCKINGNLYIDVQKNALGVGKLRKIIDVIFHSIEYQL